jgi:hypothetical protein
VLLVITHTSLLLCKQNILDRADEITALVQCAWELGYAGHQAQLHSSRPAALEQEPAAATSKVRSQERQSPRAPPVAARQIARQTQEILRYCILGWVAVSRVAEAASRRCSGTTADDPRAARGHNLPCTGATSASKCKWPVRRRRCCRLLRPAMQHGQWSARAVSDLPI